MSDGLSCLMFGFGRKALSKPTPEMLASLLRIEPHRCRKQSYAASASFILKLGATRKLRGRHWRRHSPATQTRGFPVTHFSRYSANYGARENAEDRQFARNDPRVSREYIREFPA